MEEVQPFPVEVIIGTYEQYLIGYQLKVDQVGLDSLPTSLSVIC
jgi:hypothetical protein